MVDDRRAKTYFGQAQHTDDDLGGRYAKVHSTTVVGSSPASYPAQPSTSPWHHDPVPPEMPLGYSVEEMEPVGEIHERSGDATGPPSTTAAPVVEGVSGRPSDGNVSVTQSKKPSTRIKRRM
jgi:hypothetical protein